MTKGNGTVTALHTKLNSLNKIYGIWRFNGYLRVTYVAPGWLVVWDHRHDPPDRYDFKGNGDHQTVCGRVADQLQKLAQESHAESVTHK